MSGFNITDSDMGAASAAADSGITRTDVDPLAQYQERGDDMFEEPCAKCRGTGAFTRGTFGGACFACKGTGKRTFKTSPEARAKSAQARENRAVKDANELTAQVEAWREDNPVISAWLDRGEATGFGFAVSLAGALRKWGSLTDNQAAAASNAAAKFNAACKDSTSNVEGEGIAKIRELFATAQASGLKRPKLRIGELAISLAPITGKNGGCLYVKSDDEYQGKITESGEFHKVRSARSDILSLLQAIADDPMEQAVAHGRKTGNCACCGRELTDPKSIEIGIGPVCLDNWGF